MKRSTKTTALNLTKLPYGAFVVFGCTRAPQCVVLDALALRVYADRRRITDAAKAIRATFGTGAEYALPAHSKDCMELIALQYVGPYQREVRGMCALIALGEPFNPEGGTRVEPKRPKPTPRSPAGVRIKFKSQSSIIDAS
jgi:hypothetical protein